MSSRGTGAPSPGSPAETAGVAAAAGELGLASWTGASLGAGSATTAVGTWATAAGASVGDVFGSLRWLLETVADRGSGAMMLGCSAGLVSSCGLAASSAGRCSFAVAGTPSSGFAGCRPWCFAGFGSSAEAVAGVPSSGFAGCRACRFAGFWSAGFGSSAEALACSAAGFWPRPCAAAPIGSLPRPPRT